MASCNPINNNMSEPLKTILTNEDMDDLQKSQAIDALVQECLMTEMIFELKQLNQYMAIITDHRI